MNTTDTPPDTPTAGLTPGLTPGLAPTDPRAVFAAAVRTAGDVIAGVQPTDLGRPTPCDGMDVAELLGHLVMVLDRVAALGNGENPMALPDHTLDAPADPAGWVALWTGAAHRVQQAWADPATLDRPMTLPWVQGPGGMLLGSYVAELTVHTWDLATALGHAADYDERALQTAWVAYQASLPEGDREARFAEVRAQLPPEMQDGPPPFRNAMPVAADAALIDRVVAWTGRRP